MARYIGPKAKIARKFGENIFGNAKITKILERKNYSPGQHGQSRRRRPSNYGLQLKEKQKIKYMYGLLERQFRNFFQKADKMSGETGLNLLQILECRLDNVVYRLGFSPTRAAARQMVNHKHFLVNGKSVNIPSYLVKENDQIGVRSKSRKLAVIHDSVKQVRGDLDSGWLSLDKASLSGMVTKLPEKEDFDATLKVQMVVELYSK
ncbi:MAG TPA: 30S ribosomal protein S4 [Candidatus Marinimicrobia bacterium]|jgi:small subunit ribosomal protein S4|nr:30S ribosomal protein S4 [Candidatus Neomarinimicrobiota bacterium]HIB02965.1 30S ribosomal protein S4 [Candidatus Neomarinimicrobiota bacterium]HIB70517.1 30S ribosomal protein S4 [Candidatus Neomarinimicrobiota bacterium]HIB95811.1 30S ribosomal protein S4 [Candidatus Neomarinimicrobiota bacterium]HIC73596.1 30S ribosomal protein S4 [Candidatus Neomarinimicrobiota bacterium]